MNKIQFFLSVLIAVEIVANAMTDLLSSEMLVASVTIVVNALIGALFGVVLTTQPSVNSSSPRSSTSPSGNMKRDLKNVNELLEDWPKGERFDVENREKLRSDYKFFQIENDMHECLGITGPTRTSQSNQNVVYDVEDAKIRRFIGDPSNNHVADPFYEFKPTGRSSEQQQIPPGRGYRYGRGRGGYHGQPRQQQPQQQPGVSETGTEKALKEIEDEILDEQ